MVHSHGRGAGFYARFLKLFGRLSVIHTFHGVHREKSIIGEIKFILDRSLCYFCDMFIFVSEDEKRKALAARIVRADSSSIVIMNGVKIPGVQSGKRAQAEPFVFSLGRNDKAKGMDIFVSFANAYLNHSKSNIKFMAAGPGLAACFPDTQEIEIRDALSKAEVQETFSRARVYISCSRSEGMPLAILEALANGCWLLLSRIPGHNYFIDAGVAVGFELESFDSFKEGLDLLLKKEQLINLEGREFVIKNHGVTQMCTEISSVYRSVR